ncbi:unnamed protein product [Microthlaspi erraticum]|uniref:Uncharacterized protein n=1 Tax=Microthlaspi erraticum TaxID=1685480 RepID=A0A6D2KZE2_9BRAS|nr:unnamed protein product [Microthlaspi erraticum]
MEMMKTTKAEELVQSQMRREIKSFDDEDLWEEFHQEEIDRVLSGEIEPKTLITSYGFQFTRVPQRGALIAWEMLSVCPNSSDSNWEFGSPYSLKEDQASPAGRPYPELHMDHFTSPASVGTARLIQSLFPKATHPPRKNIAYFQNQNGHIYYRHDWLHVEKAALEGGRPKVTRKVVYFVIGRHILSPIISKSTRSSFSDLTNLLVSLRHNNTTVKLFPPLPPFTAVFSLAKIVHHRSEVFPGVDLQFNLRALLNLWAELIISRSSSTLFMLLCSGRHVFMLFTVTSTGLSAGLSSDYSDLGSKVLLTCWRISNPTSVVQEYHQSTGVPLNLPLSIMEIDSKRLTALTASPRAIHLVHPLSIANELEIVFKTIIKAFLKKLPVFIIDLNCLTYPFIALYFISASSCFYFLAKNFQLPSVIAV